MSFLGMVFGWDKADREDRKTMVLQGLRRRAFENGWMYWFVPYSTADNPYAYDQVWIWRVEWKELPHLVSPRNLDPMMNVNGLLWKPARAGEVEPESATR